jgi:hypothetical protein
MQPAFTVPAVPGNTRARREGVQERARNCDKPADNGVVAGVQCKSNCSVKPTIEVGRAVMEQRTVTPELEFSTVPNAVSSLLIVVHTAFTNMPPYIDFMSHGRKSSRDQRCNHRQS